MTKKDYILIASVLKQYNESYIKGWDFNIFEAFADILAKDNNKFDKIKFYKACGIEKIV